jgi:predicted enzyme related to lactoylglutathione lyase
MSRPVHFEIQAADPKRAIAFYTALFGWAFNKWEGPMDYWLIKTGEKGTMGIDGGLLPRKGPPPVAMQAVNAYVCTMGVDNLDAKLKQVGALGTMIVVPKMAVPGIGWLAYANDTEGNIFGMMQPDTTAK